MMRSIVSFSLHSSCKASSATKAQQRGIKATPRCSFVSPRTGGRPAPACLPPRLLIAQAKILASCTTWRILSQRNCPGARIVCGDLSGAVRSSYPQLVKVVCCLSTGRGAFPPRYRVAEYVPFASAPGGGGPVAAEDAAPIAEFGAEAWPNYGQPYLDESLIKDGRWYVRANKIVGLLVQLARAVAQLQRQARARGELR